MFGLFSILYGFLLLANAIVILDDKRFLTRVCLPLSPEHRGKLGENRRKIVDLINAVRTVMKIPLIVLNIICIVYELLLG
ncbi:Protein transport protein YOS1 [Nosema bombycis CQ1]|uniref:Protein transport protein YOS1 n=2 Tax=Nosema bombycis TaxID=27978 RepID=R0MCA1_NOSB1|nr:unknown [Nosema bombycis]EOB11680.1 Protein transport protein YOS1 [Nosema bombycis CQ1]EOB12205.1 Protein transport protein YOS1 [Nosema bombycis CQ1]|eukprot:EOB11680.1 Protein transport protein YOS1 [Nosema bombycis CQ1]